MTAVPRRVRVLVVDDSALVRKALSEALALDPEIEVVGTACDPYVAREKIVRLEPDVLTLDLEMPRMDGMTFLRILMEHHPMPVVVVSSLTQAGSKAALEALEAGAVDVLGKPGGTMSVGDIAGRIAFHVKAAAASARFLAAGRRGGPARPRSVVAAPAPPAPRRAPGSGRRDTRQVIVIGASTGGVEALRTVLPQLPDGLPPIAVVQHISPHFSGAVATRLDTLSALRVREATDGMPLEPGGCLIAPGDRHLALVRAPDGYRARILATPPIHHCRPSVDVLFRSAAEVAGAHAIAVLLTGMGSDGALGMAAIRRAGGRTLAEHESTCVVYGMPRAAIESGVVDDVVPLSQVAGAILAAVEAGAGAGA
ncbi:MAG: chemotaxis response regulator protein-glutamate methylesterase [Planctomycetaceae bacterium]